MSTKIKRIEKEFIIKTLFQKKEVFKIKAKQKESQGQIYKYDDNQIILNCSPQVRENWSIGEKISVFFNFLNITHTFHSSILKIDKEKICISQSSEVYKDLKRKFSRISVTNDIKVQFTTETKNIVLSFPKTRYEFLTTLPPNFLDLDNKNIKDLIEDFRIKLQKKGIENKIIMLRNRSIKNMEEKLMAWSGKSLWIAQSNIPHLPYESKTGEKLYLIQDDVIDYYKHQGKSQEQTEKIIINFIDSKNKEGLFSTSYTPIIFKKYLVGYIQLIHYMKEIDLESLKYAIQFSQLLCYTLEKNRYFDRGHYEQREYFIPLINISATGLLFCHECPELPKELLLNKIMDINLNLNSTEIKVKAKIVRKFKHHGQFYFAMSFEKIENKTFTRLHQELYGKQLLVQPLKPRIENVNINNLD